MKKDQAQTYRRELPDGHDVCVGPGSIQVRARTSAGWQWFDVASNTEACGALSVYALNIVAPRTYELPDGHDIRVAPDMIEVQVRGSRPIDVELRGKWLEVATTDEACEILADLAREAMKLGEAGDPVDDTTEWEMVGADGRPVDDTMTFVASTEDEARDMARRSNNLPSTPVRFVRKEQRQGDGLAEGAVGAALGALAFGPIGLVMGGAVAAMLGSGAAARHEDSLATLEHAFLGSDFFPIRIGDRIEATRDDVIVATVRLRDGAIVVEQVGKGKKAVANAKRVAQLFVNLGARPRPPVRSSGLGRRMRDETVTYAVLDNGKVLARRAPADEVAEAMWRAKPPGDATVIDERDGTVVISGTDGDEATLATVEMLLHDHESNHVVAAGAQPFALPAAVGTYRCWVVTKKKPRDVKVWHVALKRDAIREVTAAVREHKSEGGVESHDPRKPYETTWSWQRGKLIKTEFY
jgi:hypothetical protein